MRKSKGISNLDFVKIYIVELLRAKKVEIISYRQLAGGNSRKFNLRMSQ